MRPDQGFGPWRHPEANPLLRHRRGRSRAPGRTAGRREHLGARWAPGSGSGKFSGGYTSAPFVPILAGDPVAPGPHRHGHGEKQDREDQAEGPTPGSPAAAGAQAAEGPPLALGRRTPCRVMSAAVDVVDQADEDGQVSSLALYAISVPEESSSEALSECPRRREWCWFDPNTGQVHPARCRANSCPWCVVVNAGQVGRAIGLAKPERAILLTGLAAQHQQRRAQIKKLSYLVRQNGSAWNVSWHTEPNPQRTGFHAHAWQYGDFIDQRKLDGLAHQAGMGMVRISRVRAKVGAGTSAGYGVKMVTGLRYGMKLVDAEASAKVYLEANGGRLVHSTRGYWRDDQGKKLTQREAMTWRPPGGEREAWQLIRRADLGSALAGVRRRSV